MAVDLPRLLLGGELRVMVAKDPSRSRAPYRETSDRGDLRCRSVRPASSSALLAHHLGKMSPTPSDMVRWPDISACCSAPFVDLLGARLPKSHPCRGPLPRPIRFAGSRTTVRRVPHDSTCPQTIIRMTPCANCRDRQARTDPETRSDHPVLLFPGAWRKSELRGTVLTLRGDQCRHWNN
jgi:hypothetical protein